MPIKLVPKQYEALVSMVRDALEQVFAMLRAQGVTTLSASVVRGEHSPLGFYLSIGFIEANEVTSSGEWLILKSL